MLATFILLCSSLLIVQTQELQMFSPLSRTAPYPEVFPCGGSNTPEPHLLSSPGQIEPLQWQVTTPDPSAMCEVRLISSNNFYSYTSLSPLNTNSAFFPCMRNEGIERVLIKLPTRNICAECTFQVLVRREKAVSYVCSDFQMVFGKQSCEGKCLNGGSCELGRCECAGEFYGEACESERAEKGVWGVVWGFLMASLMGFVFISVVYLYFHPEHLPENLKRYLQKNAFWALRREGAAI